MHLPSPSSTSLRPSTTTVTHLHREISVRLAVRHLGGDDQQRRKRLPGALVSVLGVVLVKPRLRADELEAESTRATLSTNRPKISQPPSPPPRNSESIGSN